MKRTVVLFLFIVLVSGTARASDEWTSFLTNKFSTDYVRAIIPEGNTVWCATDGGIVKWDMLSETYTLEKAGRFFSAVIDWNGTKWFGCDTGLYALKDTTWTSFTKENTPSLNKGTGTVLFVTADNVNKRIICMLYYQYGQLEYRYTLLSYNGQKWEELRDFSDGYGGVLPFLVVDTVNPWDLWGCGTGTYLSIHKKETQGYVGIHIFFYDAGFNQSTSIAIDRENNLWIGIVDRHDNGVIGFYDRTNITFLGSDVTGTIGRIKKVVIDRKGVKWFGSDGALVRYDDKTWSAYPFQRIDEYEHVIALAADESGDIWMGRGYIDWAKGYGLWRFHPTQSGVEDAALPHAVKITGNSPNPFNPSTTISFSLSAPGKAELAVYSITGQRVRTLVSGALSEGAHSVAWDGRDDSGKAVSSGVYLSRLSAGKHAATGKMVLLR